MKLVIKDAVNRIATSEPNGGILNVILYLINGALSVTLVLLGGLFAGLTLSFMGQDRLYLQVIADSGSFEERHNAKKVLNVLQRGKHWVLVTLLLGNVITNETLPIILDHDVKGGWFAVFASTILIVVFGEIIPQSICAKYGLPIGAWSSRYVLWAMNLLFPVAYPIAKLLDWLLGAHHGLIFNRAGLKSLLVLHGRLNCLPTERLSREEVTVISSLLDLKDRPIWSIMTPMSKLLTLSFDAPLNAITIHNILKSGCDAIPIYMQEQTKTFVGLLTVMSLVALNTENEITVGELALEILPAIRKDASCQEIFQAVKDRKFRMVLVTEEGSPNDEPLGIVTVRDLLEVLVGGVSSEDSSL